MLLVAQHAQIVAPDSEARQNTGEAALVHQPEPRRFFLRFLASSTSSHDPIAICPAASPPSLPTHEPNRIEPLVFLRRDKQHRDPSLAAL